MFKYFFKSLEGFPQRCAQRHLLSASSLRPEIKAIERQAANIGKQLGKDDIGIG